MAPPARVDWIAGRAAAWDGRRGTHSKEGHTMRFTRLVTLAAALVAMCGFSAARAVASSPVSFSSATVELDDPCDGGGIMTTGDLTAPKFVSVPEEIELKGLLIQTVSGGLAFVHFQGTGPDYEGLGHYQGIFNGAASLGLSGGITVPFAGL